MKNKIMKINRLVAIFNTSAQTLLDKMAKTIEMKAKEIKRKKGRRRNKNKINIINSQCKTPKYGL